jgi:conjugative transposon TraJ protein
MYATCVRGKIYSLKKMFRDGFREFRSYFQAAALVIDTIRTFFLIVLSILGPIAFAISVWDGFQSTLTQWLTRYISVSLVTRFRSFLVRCQDPIVNTPKGYRQFIRSQFYSRFISTVYIIFMIIGIIGYFYHTYGDWMDHSGWWRRKLCSQYKSNNHKTGNTVGAGTQLCC